MLALYVRSASTNTDWLPLVPVTSVGYVVVADVVVTSIVVGGAPENPENPLNPEVPLNPENPLMPDAPENPE